MTLCCFCRNAVPSGRTGNGCSWSRSFRPVPGWKAKPDTIRGPAGKVVHTYEVIRCPEFLSEQTKEGTTMKTRTWDTARAEQLLAEGHNMLEIAEMVGASAATVRSYFAKQTKQKPEASGTAPVVKPAEDTPEEPSDRPTFTAGRLIELLREVSEDVSVEFDGAPIQGVGINKSYYADGSVASEAVYLW